MEAPFLLLGLWAQGKSRIPKHLAAFLIAGLLVAPIPERYTQAPMLCVLIRKFR